MANEPKNATPTDPKGEDKAGTETKNEAAKAKPKKVPGLRITTRRNGFRRGGRIWHGTTEVPAEEFSKEQIKQLKDERLLIVEEIEIKV